MSQTKFYQVTPIILQSLSSFLWEKLSYSQLEKDLVKNKITLRATLVQVQSFGKSTRHVIQILYKCSKRIKRFLNQKVLEAISTFVDDKA